MTYTYELLLKKYPPSDPCDCEVCRSYCIRPGWWAVEEAERAIEAGYGSRMMLEIAPDFSFGVLSPAFNGCEAGLALNQFKSRGCNFLRNNLCELHGTGHQPLECRYCHHTRVGMGSRCHADIERDWKTSGGKALVVRWGELTGFWARLNGFRNS